MSATRATCARCRAPSAGAPGSSPSRWPCHIGGRSISAVCALPIADCAKFLQEVDFTARERQIAERVIKEIDARLGFLLDVGLDYLSLDRPPAPCPVARRSGSGWPPRSGPGWSGSSTCWTSRRSGCTSATTTG